MAYLPPYDELYTDVAFHFTVTPKRQGQKDEARNGEILKANLCF